MKKSGRRFLISLTACLLLCVTVFSICAIVISFRYDFYQKTEDEVREVICSQYAEKRLVEYLGITQGRVSFEMYDDIYYRLLNYAETGTVHINPEDECRSYLFQACGVRDINGEIRFDIEDFLSNHPDTTIPNRYYEVGLYTDRIVETKTALLLKVLPIIYAGKWFVYLIGMAALLGSICMFFMLFKTAGKHADDEESREEKCEDISNRCPFDVLCLIVALITVGGAYLVEENITDVFGKEIGFAAVGVILVVLAAILTANLAGRLKQSGFIKDLLIYKIIRSICRGFRHVGRKLQNVMNEKLIAWGCIIILVALSVLEGYALSHFERTTNLTLWCVEKVLLIPLIFYVMIGSKKILKSGEKLAAGEFTYETDTRGMFWGFRSHAENLNSISKGMSKAVESSLKSERMKTELITNVSHDIKTPLTSIINYATLIGEEKTENATITEYAEVLVRQSDKLKKLIEDLIEASKAATGNLEVVCEPCDAGVLLTQLSGEFDEKFTQAQLALVTEVPDREVKIEADSRRIWRAFDNLLNNICKYGMPNTRVYLSLSTEGDRAVFSLKNISKTALNITPEELMERFVRGDSSRNTEGNGLGLSIAKSLINLQKGDMHIDIDGDLFKVIIKMPLLKDESDI